jgi:hypothetical protein
MTMMREDFDISKPSALFFLKEMIVGRNYNVCDGFL